MKDKLLLKFRDQNSIFTLFFIYPRSIVGLVAALIEWGRGLTGLFLGGADHQVYILKTNGWVGSNS